MRGKSLTLLQLEQQFPIQKVNSQPIEAGSNEMAPSHQRQSFFTMERYRDLVGEAEIFFLGPTYESPEQAINAALA